MESRLGRKLCPPVPEGTLYPTRGGSADTHLSAATRDQRYPVRHYGLIPDFFRQWQPRQVFLAELSVRFDAKAREQEGNETLAKNGWNVTLTGRRPEPLEKVAEEIRALITAVGTGVNTHEDFARLTIARLARATGQ